MGYGLWAMGYGLAFRIVGCRPFGIKLTARSSFHLPRPPLPEQRV